MRKFDAAIIRIAINWADGLQLTGKRFKLCSLVFKIDDRQQLKLSAAFDQLELIAWLDPGRFWNTQSDTIASLESTDFPGSIHKLYIPDIPTIVNYSASNP
jgi:hypothetical protein